jgi:hypothetical protein
MDSKRLLERIERGELKFEEDFDRFTVQIELEAADTLGMLLKTVRLDSVRRPENVQEALRKQATALVENLTFIDEFKVIEVDGISHAVQVRSAKPTAEGFSEIVLRGGYSIAFERRGSALHIAKKAFERLTTAIAETL